MNAENLPPEEEEINPDTNTDDELGSESPDASSPPVAEAVPVAEPADEPAEQPAPPPPPAGPRVFPQHFSLLFGATAILVAAFSVWERMPVFAAEVRGTAMISGAFLMAVAGYCVIVGALNIMTGRLQGMLASFVAGVSALYFGIRGLFSTMGAEKIWNAAGEMVARGWLSRDELKLVINEDRKALALQAAEATGDPNPVFTEATFQEVANAAMSQIAPGVWLSLLGGLIIILVFIKAIFGGKKKEPAPAPSSRRRRR